MLEQRAQLIQLSRECFNILLGRNADAIQRGSHTGVERLLDLVELNFDLALDAGDVAVDRLLDRFDLAVGGFYLLVDQFLAFAFDAFTGLDQFLEVLGPLGTRLGIGTQASEVDLA